jgi:hypothetical protein
MSLLINVEQHLKRVVRGGAANSQFNSRPSDSFPFLELKQNLFIERFRPWSSVWKEEYSKI